MDSVTTTRAEQFVVVKKALVKSHADITSAKVGVLRVGEHFTALEVRGNRVKCCHGWVSIVSAKHNTLLQRISTAAAHSGVESQSVGGGGGSAGV